MSSYQRTRLFRSEVGCCICRTKSSTSRFVSSSRYKDSIGCCFKVDPDERSGDICNACVLHIKRFNYSSRSCEHVVDSRLKTGIRQRLKRLQIHDDYVSRKHRYKSKKRAGSIESDDFTPDRNRTSPADRSPMSSDSEETDATPSKGFFANEHFHRTRICCGNIYTSANSLAFDACLTRPCLNPSTQTSIVPANIAVHLNPINHNFITSPANVLDKRLRQYLM